MDTPTPPPAPVFTPTGLIDFLKGEFEKTQQVIGQTDEAITQMQIQKVQLEAIATAFARQIWELTQQLPATNVVPFIAPTADQAAAAPLN
jgi:hypothetical protein